MLQQDVGDAQPLQERGRPVGGLVGKLLGEKKIVQREIFTAGEETGQICKWDSSPKASAGRNGSGH